MLAFTFIVVSTTICIANVGVVDTSVCVCVAGCVLATQFLICLQSS